MSNEGAANTRHLAAWLEKLEEACPRLRVESMDDVPTEVALGQPVKISAQLFLDALTPKDVTVEIVTGRVNADGGITDFFTTPMRACELGRAIGLSFRI